jgi:hypothetical protein
MPGRPPGQAVQSNGLTLSLALVAALRCSWRWARAQGGGWPLWGANLGNNFYNLFPHNLLVGMFAPVFLFVVFALSMCAASGGREARHQRCRCQRRRRSRPRTTCCA